jgi:excisionase family DNA binding protein
VAEHFDVSVATIYRAIESGQLTALKLGTGTGTFRVTGAAVAAYAEACVRAAYDSWFLAGASGERSDQSGPAVRGVLAAEVSR